MSRAAANPVPPASFETALQELETIVRGMESGDASIEQSLAAYERGVSLLKYCQDTLATAEQKLQVLEGGALRALSPSEQGSGEP